MPSTSCNACAGGEFQRLSGKTVCLSVQICRKGSHETAAPTTSTDRVCEECAIGRYSDADAATSCKACVGNEFQDSAGQAACRVHTVCAAGARVTQTPNQNRNRICGACAPGKYSAAQNSDSCAVCPQGKYEAAGGQPSCIACAAGKVAGSGAVTSAAHCEACASGQYQSRDGQTLCIECAAGSYSTSGLPSCVACASAHFQDVTGQDSCKSCEACAAGAQRKGCGGAAKGYCGICSPGTFVDGRGVCVDCPAGQFTSQENAGSCDACPAGKYKATTKAFFCDACAPGRFGIGDVSQDAASYCQACPPGQIQKASARSSCDACTAGQFQSTAGKTVCLGVQRCRKGAYLSTNATTSADRVCTNCAAGQIADADDATVCKACAAGSFQDQAGQGACRAHRVCAAGTLVTQAPSTTVDRTCGACVVGRFAASTNSASCI